MKLVYSLSMHGRGICPRAIKLKMLHPRLTNDVISIISPLISILSRLRILSVASHESQTTIIQIIKTLAKAPITSAL